MNKDEGKIKKSNIDRSRIGEGIYLLYFAIMVGARAAGLYEGMTIYNITLVIGMLLFAGKMIVTEHSFREYLMAAGFLLVSGIVYFHTGEKGLLVCFTMMLGMKDVSVKKVIQTGAVVAGAIILIKVFMGVFGLTSEIYYPQERAGAGIMFRHALGYAHPNTLHMNVLMLSMMIIYLVTCNHRKKEKLDKIIVVAISTLVFLFNLYIFQYSGSRTGVLACLVYLTVNVWLYLRKNIDLFEKVLSYLAFPVVSFVAIVLPFTLSGKWFDFFDKTVFNTRFTIAKYFWSNNTLSLFGIRLINPEDGYRTYGIDMAQLYLLLQLGILAFVLVSTLTIWYIYECIKHERKAELAILIGMLFLGMWEPLLYNLGFKNFVYVFAGAMLFGMLGQDMSFFDEEQSIWPKTMTDKLKFDQQEIIKKLLGIFSLAIVVGAIVSCCYLFLTPQPTALYGDRQENEAGFTFGMKPLYISAEEMDLIEASGDIVIGYVDDMTPMYKYNETIACMEYEKKVMSYGVWAGLFTVLLLMALLCYNVARGKR